MLRGDPDRDREWRQRSARKSAEKQRERRQQAVQKPVDKPPRSKSKKQTRNDAPWRRECEAVRGARCRHCGTVGWLECDHIVPRSQGGPSVVENGLLLCKKAHDEKTASRLLIEFDWLDDDQIAWLAAVGWVAWDQAGQPYGRGCRHFAPRRVEQHGAR